MPNLTVGQVYRFTFNTDLAGTPITLAGSPSLAAYKDGGLTQSTAGLALSVNHDGVTGLHQVTVTTAADAAFYSAGSNFSVVLAAGTVGGVSVVGKVIPEGGNFSIQNEFELSAAGLLDLTDGVETGFTLRQSLRLMLASLVGKLTGPAPGTAGTVTIRDVNDTKARITATVDANSQRTAVTKDAT